MQTLEEEMTAMSWVVSVALLVLVETGSVQSATGANADPTKAQITLLYDAFGQNSAMQKDWGYAALVEYGGKRILFDTGNNPDILAQNAKAKGIDLAELDFVVMSHRHGDHMGGLSYVLSVNPRVPIYAPKEFRVLIRAARSCRSALTTAAFSVAPSPASMLVITSATVSLFHSAPCGSMHVASCVGYSRWASWTACWRRVRAS
jgi:glyoxylase-like metal-dependent hydrolase (beta-lactamase superfamily II)